MPKEAPHLRGNFLRKGPPEPHLDTIFNRVAPQGVGHHA